MPKPRESFFGRLKSFAELVWFLFGWVLPLLLFTRRRPVLLSRYMALGDILCTFPAALELKKRHSGAPIIFHCRADFACLPRLGGVTTHVISKLNVDRMKSTFAFLFAGIYEFTYGDEFANRASTESVIEEYCLQHGVPVTAAHAPLPITPLAQAKARKILQAAGLDQAGPIIALHPGPSGPFREWNPESWTGLAQALKNSGCQNILQLGVSRPDDVGTALQNGIPNVVSLVNKLSLEESIALISLCDVFIGIDSGLLHIAAAVGTHFVGLFGSTSPQLRFSAANARGCVVSRVPCQGCHHRIPRLHWVTGCPYNFDCMKTIQVDEVLQAGLAALKKTSVPAMSSVVK
jgi:ADP-heptose:LPS heptosyltransferase